MYTLGITVVVPHGETKFVQEKCFKKNLENSYFLGKDASHWLCIKPYLSPQHSPLHCCALSDKKNTTQQMDLIIFSSITIQIKENILKHLAPKLKHDKPDKHKLTVKNYIRKNCWGVLMELLGYGKNVMLVGRGNVKGWSDLNVIIPAYVLGKQEEIKAMSVFIILLFSLGPCRSLNWANIWRSRKEYWWKW